MHILCPHCHNPIEVVKISAREEIACPSCGSSFRLETESTTGWENSAGQKLGKFELIDTIGHGAFGTVYKARDPELDRTVAVKVPRAGNLAGPQELDRFLREARSAAQLRHPSIVPVHEVGTADGVPYLVSDFVQGVTLADLLSARRHGFREAADLVAAVADALGYAHECGVVHRDIKPSNIMIGDDGIPHVMDFGLAKREAGEITMTVEGQVLGTPAYMPPEQARGEGHAVDARGDVYSLGVVLYQLLTGELPFRGTARMLLHQVLHDEPRRPRSLNDHVPRDLETITLKAMAKEPGRRYQTARELADDLRRWLKGEPIRARPVGRLERGWRWAKRRPAVAGLLAGIIGVTALALVLVTWQWLRAEERAESETVAREAAETAEQHTDQARKDEKAQREAAEKAQQEEARQRTEAEANLRSARLNLYAALLARADASLRDNRFAEAVDILQGCPPENRGWEWGYLMRRSLGTPHVLLGHTGPVDCVAYSRDGKLLASCSRRVNWMDGLIDGGEVILWDAVSGRALHTFRDTLADIASVAFSPDGQRLAAAGSRGQWNDQLRQVDNFHPFLKVWDTKTGREVFSLRGKEVTLRYGPSSDRVVYSPDGRTLAWGRNVKDRQNDSDLPAHGQRRQRLHAAGLVGAGATPGQGLSLVCNHAAHLELQQSFRSIVTLNNALDGQESASYSSLMTGAVLAESHQPVGLVGLAFSPDGGRLAMAENVINRRFEFTRTGGVAGKWSGRVKVWDLGSGKVLVLRGPVENTDIPYFFNVPGPITGVVFSPDGTRMPAAGNAHVHDFVNSDSKGFLKVWDARSGKELQSKGPLGALTSGIVYSPDGRKLACADPPNFSKGLHELKVWDADTLKELASLRGHTGVVRHLAFSPDGRRLASASEDKTIRLWDLGGDPGRVSLPGRILAISQDGRRLATVENKSGGNKPDEKTSVIHVWDATTLQPLATFPGPQREVGRLALSPDGQRVVAVRVYGAGEITVWDATLGRKLATFQNERFGFYALTLSPDGQRVASPGFRSDPSGSSEKLVTVWSTVTGKEMFTVSGLDSSISSLLFSPDGKRLAIGLGPRGLFPGNTETSGIQVYDAQSGRKAFSITLSGDGVGDLAFSDDRRRMAFLQHNGQRWVCDAETGRDVIGLPDSSAWSFNSALSRDGQRLVTCDTNAVIRFWDVKGQQVAYSLRNLSASLWRARWLPDGRRLAVECADEVLLLDSALAPDVEQGLAAYPLVDRLFHELGAREAVLERLRADKVHPPGVLALARRVAEARPEPPFTALSGRSRSVVLRPGHDTGAYRLALLQAEAAQRAAPEDAETLFTLALARYRNDKFKEAEEAFKRATARLKEPTPDHPALEVMICHRLGQTEQSRAALERLRELLKKYQLGLDSYPLAREADTLVKSPLSAEKK